MDIDEKTGEVTRKEGGDLLLVDLDDESNLLGRKSVFVGQQCTSLMKDLNLTPLSSQLDFFYEKVFSFYKTVARQLQKYFATGLNCDELKWMAALSPMNRTKANTPKAIMSLARSYSKVIHVIAPGDGFDTLRHELELYQVDKTISDTINNRLSYEDYWKAVAALMVDGVDDEDEKSSSWARYEVLPRFAMALGTPFNSGSEMESLSH